MDKIKKYIRCGFKIVTTWKFIVFFLGITFICYYILLNRYEFVVLNENQVMINDRVTGDSCIYKQTYQTGFYSSESICDEKQLGTYLRFYK
jgi:hypothetical protein